MQTHMFNSRRVEKALHQIGRKKGVSLEVVNQSLQKAQDLAGMCGEFSQNRRMVTRLGRVLMTGGQQILVPVCLNYGDLSDYQRSVELFVQGHAAFLSRVCMLVPILTPNFVVPDLEVLNADISRISRKTLSEMSEILENVFRITFAVAKDCGWQTVQMSTLIPDLALRERRQFDELQANISLERKIVGQTHKRAGMYRRNGEVSFDEMKLRTMQTAAQYTVLGSFAANSKAIICNHTTTSLCWYMHTEAAVLHNPISLF